MSDASSYPNAQPGWYPQDGGHLRWWDGYNWGPYAQPGGGAGYPNPGDSKTWAALAQGTHFVLGWIGSLIIRQTKGKDDRFVKHHATEAMNLSLAFMLIFFVAIVPLFISMIALSANSGSHYSAATGRYVSDAPPAGFFIAIALFYLVFFAISIYGAIVAIIGIVKATQGKWYRYPITIRFVRGAVSKEEAATLPPFGLPGWPN